MEQARPKIGVIAIQGAVEEHCLAVRRAGGEPFEIRRPDQVDGNDGIIIPGGESTTMAIVGANGLLPKLKEWVMSGKPVWGTCAGMILLSDHAIKTKDGGQALVGGLDVQVCRNYFGSQLQSCEAILDTRVRGPGDSSTCRAVFIRAPAILTAGEGVDVLATITARPHPSAEVQVREALEGGEKKEVKTGALKRSAHDVQKSNKRSKIDENRETKEERPDFEPTVIVAARQGNILATAFHPELTTDDRWHRYFLDMVQSASGINVVSGVMDT